MANCPNCGNELINGSIFCGSCGTRIPEGTFDVNNNVNIKPSSEVNMSVNSDINTEVNSSVNTSVDSAVDTSVDSTVNTGMNNNFNSSFQNAANKNSLNNGAPVPPYGQPINGNQNSYGQTGQNTSYGQNMSYGGQPVQNNQNAAYGNNANNNANNNNANYSNSNYNNGYSNNYTNNGTQYAAYNPAQYNAAPQPQNKTNTMCLIGMIIGIFSLVSCGMCGVASIAGWVVSAIGLKQVNQTGEEGHGMGMAGLIMNILVTVGVVIAAAFYIFMIWFEITQY